MDVLKSYVEKKKIKLNFKKKSKGNQIAKNIQRAHGQEGREGKGRGRGRLETQVLPLPLAHRGSA